MSEFKFGRQLTKAELKDGQKVFIRRLDSSGAGVSEKAEGEVQIDYVDYSFTGLVDEDGERHDDLKVKEWDQDIAMHDSGKSFKIYEKAQNS